MSEAQPAARTDVRDLTAFQKNILTVLAEEARYGLAIKRELEDYYGQEVNHGRLYPNLDDLVNKGLVEKSELDKRTNQYELTDDGFDAVLDDLEWTLSKFLTDEDRKEQVRDIVAEN
ncbi:MULTISPECIES: PadR family transcriptional regulator [Halobacterium]|jgi:DNA-binding PadR family transcriptional regulator|uniref:PadR family transcription regulator RosR n=2 Tax=Halobacterium TaxID=2239 RepID=A0A0U5AB43_9EURY|nr:MULTISPECIES: PadR family transcriptional regulator [Halobacterium]MCD2198554.1 PadR family transcriptional regulator [Halobacterium sp. KA-4]MCD2201968.1 PadR family transcriptional regulator [Halobacterium sp. KA-6]MUV61439.1 PadR family transcriptional regulator [Halobacterium sp. CBA1126]UHH25735.1 PadR family transcriptional regulator [Halobacterium noricense]CQH48419.1 PadR family transcription regulator RosR [Halobacterium hubeiense]